MAYRLTGLSVLYDADDEPVEFNPASQLTLVYSDPEDAIFRYVYAEPDDDDDDDDGFSIQAEGERPLLVDIDGVVAARFEIGAVRVTTPEDGYMDLLFFNHFHEGTGGDPQFDPGAEDLEFDAVYLVGGNQALFPTSLEELQALFDLVDDGTYDIGQITDGPFAPETDIAISSLPGIEAALPDHTTYPVVLSGVYLAFGDGDGDDDDIPEDVGPAQVTLLVRDPDSQFFSYEIIESEDDEFPVVALTGLQREQIIVNGRALGDSAEIQIGRVEFQDGGHHDVLVIHDPEKDIDLLFGLDGPLPPLNSVADFENFMDMVAGFGEIPDGPFVPDVPIALMSVDAAAQGDGAIIFSGGVEFDYDFDQIDIGTNYMQPLPDGAVTVLDGAEFHFKAESGFGPLIYIGGWGVDGHLTARGEGSTVRWEVADHEDATLWAQIGVDGGHAHLNFIDGGALVIRDPYQNEYSRAELDFGFMGGIITALFDNGSLDVSGFDMTYFSLGSGEFRLTGESTADIASGHATRMYLRADPWAMEAFGQGAEIWIEDGSIFTAQELDELHIGSGEGTGFMTVDGGAEFRAEASEDIGAMWVQVGAGGGTGTLDVRNDGLISLVNPHGGLNGGAGDPVEMSLQVGTGVGSVYDANLDEMVDRPGDGRLMVDQGGLFQIQGFDNTHIEIGTDGGEGRMRVLNGSRFEVQGATPGPVALHMDIGYGGDGSLQITNDSSVDLGGAATLQVGGAYLPADFPGWAQGQISMWGGSSSLTGIDTAWFGYDPAAPDPGGTTNNWGDLLLFDNSSFGNAGAQIHLGENSMLRWNGTPRIEGDVHLHGTMMDSHGWDNTATIDGDLNVVAGDNWVMMSATHLDDGVDFDDPGTPFVETWHITGAFNLQGGSFDLNLHTFWGYEFQRGETHQLMTYGELIDGDAGFSAHVSHLGEDDFAWKMAFDQLVDGSLTFVALNDSNPADGADPALRHALLDFSGGDTALALAYDAADPDGWLPGQIMWEGGGWHGGLASETIDEIRGTAQDDVIDLTGLESGIEVHAGAGDDTIIGGEGDDLLMGGLGDDVINGGGGINTALYTGAFADYVIDTDLDTGITTVTDTRDGPVNEGTDTLTNIHFLQFADISYEVELPVISGPALTLEFAQVNGLVTVTVLVDGDLVSGDALTDLAFTLDFDPTLISYVDGSVSAGFTVTEGSLVFDGSGLDHTAFDEPALSFDMELTTMAGERTVAFDATEVSVNGAEMEDQSFSYDFAHVPGSALTLSQTGQTGSIVSYAVHIDPDLVNDGLLSNLTFALEFDPALIGYVEDSATPGFAVSDGSLIFNGVGLNTDDFTAPVLEFDMQLTAQAGPRDVAFGLSDVSVNGWEMSDQTGDDGFDFSYDAAFFTLGGVVDIRDLRADPTTPDGTVVTFTESGGTAHEVTLGAGGSFSFLLEQGTEGSLEILRDYDTAVDKTLGLGDVFNLLYLVANYSDGGPLPWDTATADTWIAGDFTGNGQAQLTDVFQLLYHVADYHEALHDPRWVFIDQDESWDDLGIDNVPQPGAFDIGPMAADIDMSFLGILTGDLHGYV